MDSARVTAAHEFFHAIQFGYDYGEDVWLLEATATWMEERVFDDVNDNRQYLAAGQTVDSTTPLDFFNSSGSQQYGNWTFFEFLSKNYGNGVVKAIWNKAAAFRGAPDQYSTKAISTVLKPKGGFTKTYSRFASANVLPGKFYPEGDKLALDPAQVDDYTLTRAQRRTGKHGLRLLHMTSASWRVKSSSVAEEQEVVPQGQDRRPGVIPDARGLRPGRQDARASTSIFVKLNGKGNGQVIVPFSRKKVKAVYVSLVNASTRFKCGKKYAVLVLGPAHRRRPQLQGSALQVQRLGHQALTSTVADRDLRPARRHRRGGRGLGRPAGARGRRRLARRRRRPRRRLLRGAARPRRPLR